MQPCACQVDIRPALNDSAQLSVIQSGQYKYVDVLEIVTSDMTTYDIGRERKIL